MHKGEMPILRFLFYLPKTIAVLGQYRNLFTAGLPAKDVARLRSDVLDDIKISTDFDVK